MPLAQNSVAAAAHDKPAGRWRALALLAIAAFLEMTPWFSASAVLPQLRAAWGVTPSAGAWLTISVQLGFVAGALISAALSLADILPPRRLMLIGGALAAAVNIGLLASHGLASAAPFDSPPEPLSLSSTRPASKPWPPGFAQGAAPLSESWLARSRSAPQRHI